MVEGAPVVAMNGHSSVARDLCVIAEGFRRVSIKIVYSLLVVSSRVVITAEECYNSACGTHMYMKNGYV